MAPIQTSVVRSRATCPTGFVLSGVMPVRRSHRLVHAKTGDGKVTREYREDDDELIEAQAETTTSAPSQEQRQGGGAQYIDQLPDLPPRKELSDEMKAKLRNEYYGLGGSPNKTMGGNYFLYIILAISILAIMSSALGYL